MANSDKGHVSDVMPTQVWSYKDVKYIVSADVEGDLWAQDADTGEWGPVVIYRRLDAEAPFQHFLRAKTEFTRKFTLEY